MDNIIIFVINIIFKVESDKAVVILKEADGGPLVVEVGHDLSLICNYQVIFGSVSDQT